jgi:hypothetical protein
LETCCLKKLPKGNFGMSEEQQQRASRLPDTDSIRQKNNEPR